MFLQEKDLKDAFWKSYNNKGRAIRHQFECNIRIGNADLLTVEQYQGNYQLNAFEFKLNDIKKAFLQAEANLAYVNKSWIVIPVEKQELIENKYTNYLKNQKYIGVIGVTTEGRYNIIYQPHFKTESLCNQEIIKLCINVF